MTMYTGSEIIELYTEACLDFAEKTKAWGRLDEDCFYCVTHGDTWEEIHNGECGVSLDVRWAFHLEPDEVKRRAPGELLEIVLDMARNLDPENVAGFVRNVFYMKYMYDED